MPLFSDIFFQKKFNDPALSTKQVRPGSTFIALKGRKKDGREYIELACEAGAEAVIYESTLEWEKKLMPVFKAFPSTKPIPIDKDPGLYLSHIASNSYPLLPKNIMAVTGTNGKTSTAHFVYQFLNLLGYPAAYLGTNGLLSNRNLGNLDTQHLPSLTTPDILSVYRILNACKKSGVNHVVLEASSHALKLGRLEGLNFVTTGFTNLAPEHLDFHPDMEDYFETKLKLFTDHLANKGTAVINSDDLYGQKIITICQRKAVSYLTYGQKPDLTLRIEKITPASTGLHTKLSYKNETYDALLPFFGTFQVENMAAALLMVQTSTKTPLEKLIAFLPKITTPCGRMEYVGNTDKEASVFVDYAHTTDALEKALSSLRPHTKNKLWVVFGCGGDRDTTKRKPMGTVANQSADNVIITDDNPRTENPESIRRQIQEGCPEALNIQDRQEAIVYALKNAVAGDTILVAGKGHETGQAIGTKIIPYSDHHVIQRYTKN